MDPARASETDFHAFLGAGDVRRAGEWLVVRFADEVAGLCRAMVRDRSAAEDLAQDVFGRAFASLASFRGDASARTWLLQIARNRCIDHLRAKKRDPWRGAGDDASEPDAHPDDAPLPPDLILRRGDVEDAMSELGEGERALVVLRFKHGLEYAELAEAFGLREGTVRMRLSRALAKMRDALEKREGVAAAYSVESFAMPRGAPAAGAAPHRMPPPAPAQAAAPPPAPRAVVDDAASEAPAPARSGGFFQRLRAAFGAGGEGDDRDTTPPPRPRVDHPLAAYFEQTRDDEDRSLFDRLLARARAL